MFANSETIKSPHLTAYNTPYVEREEMTVRFRESGTES